MNQALAALLEENGISFEENLPMAAYTTFRIGGSRLTSPSFPRTNGSSLSAWGCSRGKQSYSATVPMSW